MCNSTLGSSFVDMEILLLGVIYNQLNLEIQFMTASLIMGISVGVAPFTGHLPGFIILISIMAVGQAYVDAGEWTD